MASLFLQSANALVSRVASYAGIISTNTGITVSALNNSVLSTEASAVGVVNAGDYIAPTIAGPYAYVSQVTTTTISLNDPDGVWSSAAYPATIYVLPTEKTVEIASCIQLAELKMRTIELPALRSDPWSATNPSYLTVDANGNAPIPADMQWPILFFQDSNNQVSTTQATGPWIIYDRVGDREIIRRKLIERIYVLPYNVPRVIRASFSEVGPNYLFSPLPGAGTVIKAYYQRTFPFLFSPTQDVLNPLVMNNAVLSSFPEGYLYGTLSAYYDKNKNADESIKWDKRFDDSYGEIEDQNFKDKWRGGERHLTSEWQPRNPRYTLK